MIKKTTSNNNKNQAWYACQDCNRNIPVDSSLCLAEQKKLYLIIGAQLLLWKCLLKILKGIIQRRNYSHLGFR